MNNYTSLVDMLIRDEVNGSPQHERVLHIGDTPSYLIESAGFPELVLAIKAKVIGKAYFDHGIPTNMIKNLPEILGRPKCLFKSANQHQSDSVVVLTFESKQGSPIVVPIKKNVQIGRGQSFNVVTSIYGKDGPNPEEKWKDSGLLLWES